MPCDYQKLPHLGIQTLAPYVPGQSIEALMKERGIVNIIKLASNENPLGCSPSVQDALASLSPKHIATYPLASQHPLRQTIADKLQVNADMITLGNGSDALVSLCQVCFALHRDAFVLTHDYAFMTYAIQAQTLGIPVVSSPLLSNWSVDIDAMIAACTEKTALIFIANPNNPTGLLIQQKDIERLLNNIPPSTILVLDEAYYEYIETDDKPNLLSLLNTHSNLIIMRTFSKIYGLAGLRLGYAIADPAITALLQRVLLPFTVNGAALVAGMAALEDSAFIQRSFDNNRVGLKQLQDGLTHLGLSYLQTSGNFITFDCQGDSLSLYRRLQEQGIIVRPLQPYGLNHHLRVTIGTPEQNDRFLNTMKELIHEK